MRHEKCDAESFIKFARLSKFNIASDEIHKPFNKDLESSTCEREIVLSEIYAHDEGERWQQDCEIYCQMKDRLF